MRPMPACSTLALLCALLAAPAALARFSDCKPRLLLENPSTIAVGLGGTVSPLADDPQAAWLAPGLGAARPMGGRLVEFSCAAYPGAGTLYPGFGADFEFDNWSYGVRLALDRILALDPSRRPLVLDLQYARHWLNTSYESHEPEIPPLSFDFNHSLRASLGTTAERWSLALGLGIDRSDMEEGLVGRVDSSHAWHGSFGVNSRWRALNIEVDPGLPLRVDWNWGLQLSRLFVGQELNFDQPLPRQDRLALANRLRVSLPASDDRPALPLIELHAAHERSACLAYRKQTGATPAFYTDGDGNRVALYFDANGDITERANDSEGNPNDPYMYRTYETTYRLVNGELLRDADDTRRSWGLELGLLGTLTVRKGQHSHPAFGGLHTGSHGWTLSSAGLLELAARTLPGRAGQAAGFLADHASFQYSFASLSAPGTALAGSELREYRVTLGF